MGGLLQGTQTAPRVPLSAWLGGYVLRRWFRALGIPFASNKSTYESAAGGSRPTASLTATDAALDVLENPACVFEHPGAIITINRYWRRLAGIDDDGGTTWRELIAEEDCELVSSRLAEVSAAVGRIDFDSRLRVVGGTARWFRLSMYRVNEELSGDGPRWLCSGVDIHELMVQQIVLERRASIQRNIIDESVDCIAVIALDGTVRFVNRVGCQALSVADDWVLGTTSWLHLWPADVRAAASQAFDAACEGESGRFEGRSDRVGEPSQWWDTMITPSGTSGRPRAVLCIAREVSAERHAQKLLLQSQQRLTIASRVGGIGVWDYDIRNDVLECDDTWYRIMGRDPDSRIRTIEDFRPLIYPDDVDAATEVIKTATALLADSRDYSIEFRIVRPRGEIRWVRSAAWLGQESGEPVRAVGFVVDITETRRAAVALREHNETLEQQRRALARQSMQDPLTSVANRRRLDLELLRICSGVGADVFPLCVGLIDIDHFKAYNDRFGHLAGDEALRQIARALSSATRALDLLARFGGEEFAFVLTAVPDPAVVMTRFHSAVADLALAQPDSPTGYLTISCGYVVRPTAKNLTPRQLLSMSDQALYEAKKRGRNTSVPWGGNMLSE